MGYFPGLTCGPHCHSHESVWTWERPLHRNGKSRADPHWKKKVTLPSLPGLSARQLSRCFLLAGNGRPEKETGKGAQEFFASVLFFSEPWVLTFKEVSTLSPRPMHLPKIHAPAWEQAWKWPLQPLAHASPVPRVCHVLSSFPCHSSCHYCCHCASAVTEESH